MKTLGQKVIPAAIIALLATGGLSVQPARADSPESSEPAPFVDEELRCEILHMKEVDQDARMAVIKAGMDLTALEKISQEIDLPNTERMKQIIAENGWPTKSLVGADGAFAAWLIVQHATHDVKFMERCLVLMQEAADKGEASRKDLALLIDRVRVRQGKPQLYGTQFKGGPDGSWVPDSIEDEAHLEERRRAMGLFTMAQEVEQIRQTYRRAPLRK
jgi:hypothetical protein